MGADDFAPEWVDECEEADEADEAASGCEKEDGDDEVCSEPPSDDEMRGRKRRRLLRQLKRGTLGADVPAGALRAAAACAALVVVAGFGGATVECLLVRHLADDAAALLDAAAAREYPDDAVLRALTALGLRASGAGRPGHTRVCIPCTPTPLPPATNIRVFVLNCIASLDEASEATEATEASEASDGGSDVDGQSQESIE